MKKLIAIDPGLSESPGGTGFAVFNEDKSILLPERTGVISPKGKSWEERTNFVVEALEDLFHEYGLGESIIYIEFPTFFSSTKGMTCATGKDGGDSDLVKLAFLVGRIAEVGRLLQNKVHLVRVNEWKGTMSKSIVEQRIAKRLGITVKELNSFGIKSHALDACGIGLYIKGVFKANAI